MPQDMLLAVQNMLVIALGLLPGPVAVGQEWARKMFDSTEHKFGTVAKGAKAEHRFQIKNLYEEDVHISGVRSSCGCTTWRPTSKAGRARRLARPRSTSSKAHQLQPASESIQSRTSLRPSASTRAPRPDGGIAFAVSRRFMRAVITERLESPGAMSLAFARPRSSSVGTTSHAFVFASVVE